MPLITSTAYTLPPRDIWMRGFGGGGSGTSDSFNAIAHDSSNNLYCCGYTNSAGSGSNDILLVKYDRLGNLKWHATLGDSNSQVGYDVAVDQNDDIYVVGVASGGIVIAKYNPSGAIQWQTFYGGGITFYGYGLAFDPNGDLYMCGYESSGTDMGILVKYDVTGSPTPNVIWKKRLSTSQPIQLWQVTTDSLGNVYVGGYIGTSTAFLIAKYDSGGSLVWRIGVNLGGTDQAKGIVTDSSNNVYVYGHRSSYFYLLKYLPDVTNNLAWKNRVQAGSSNQAQYVDLDSAGNIYTVGWANALSSTDFIITKYTSSGTVDWLRALGGLNTDYGYGVCLDLRDELAIAGNSRSIVGAGADTEALVVALKPDGSGTGTYGGGKITYAAYSYTENTNPSITEFSISYVDDPNPYGDMGSLGLTALLNPPGVSETFSAP